MMPIHLTDGAFEWELRSTQVATSFVLCVVFPMEWTLTIWRDLIGPGREGAVEQLIAAANHVNMHVVEADAVESMT